jgi:hypothetical protein
LIKKTSAKDPPHFLILFRKTSGDEHALTVWSTFFAAPSVNFFLLNFKNVETEEEEETEDLPSRRPPCFDHDPLLHYPGYLLID